MNILDHEVILELFRSYNLLFTAAVLLIAFGLTYYVMPKILWVSHEKQLMKSVNDRSSHGRAIPTFGGVAFFMVMVLILCVIQSLRLSYTGNHLLAAMTILFLVGLKDDLVISTARVKLFGQVAAALFLVFSPELQLQNLYGFFGFHEIPLLAGIALSSFLVIAIINAYNLIDGIDGLATIIGMVIAGTYAYVFYSNGHSYFLLVSIACLGMLAAYLRFNFSRGKRKIFMGDSGSMVIGLILSFLSLKILSMQPHAPILEAGYSPANRILFLLSVLFIPVFDTARVIVLRSVNGRSPFSADRNHIHHILLDYGFKHWQSSVFLGIVNILVVVLYLQISNPLSSIEIGISLLTIYLGFGLLFFYLTRNIKKRKPPKNYIPRNSLIHEYDENKKTPEKVRQLSFNRKIKEREKNEKVKNF